jgi:hypothetical protein
MVANLTSNGCAAVLDCAKHIASCGVSQQISYTNKHKHFVVVALFALLPLSVTLSLILCLPFHVLMLIVSICIWWQRYALSQIKHPYISMNVITECE